MTAPDFARCPKRTARCPAPSYCQPTCRHATDWLRSQGVAIESACTDPEPVHQADLEDDGFVTAHCTGGWE